MRTIKLKSLSLVNFKGIRNLDVNFPGLVTEVMGKTVQEKLRCLILSFGCCSVKTALDDQTRISTLKRWMKTESPFLDLNTMFLVFWTWTERK